MWIFEQIFEAVAFLFLMNAFFFILKKVVDVLYFLQDCASYDLARLPHDLRLLEKISLKAAKKIIARRIN